MRVETRHAASLQDCARIFALFSLLPFLTIASPTADGAERAATYADALDRAKLTGKDIAVFQRGSDWNRLGERLLADVWNQPAFARAAGSDMILVSVDQPEVVGNPPVSGVIDDAAEPRYEEPATPISRLRNAVDPAKPLPENAIASVTTTNGSVYSLDTNGMYLASGANPAQETITMRVDARAGGSLLRFDFPLHDSLPGRGPGRASNGNFAISEVELAEGSGAPLRADAAWASASEGAWGPWQAIDGISDKGDNLWNALAHQHQPRAFLLALEKPVPAGAVLTVRLICVSQWGQHVPGTLRAAVLAAPEVEAAVRQVGRAEAENARNARFTWRGDDVPRVALMDSEGRPVASEDQPRLGLTPESLAARLRGMQALRIRRDELWAQAEKQEGIRKAELLMQSLDLLQLGGSPGHENAYKFVHEKMRAADTNDASGCLRWLEFQTEPRAMPALVNPAYKLSGEKKFEEAIALLDAELKKPANRRLTSDHLQRILMAKYHVYRQWPDHDAQRLDVLREIAKLNPATYLGIGAAGYLAMFHKNPEPFSLTYGWATNHVRAGANAWDFRHGTTNHFDHAGRYTLRILHGGGKGTLKINRAALVAGGQTLSEAAPAADLAPGGKLEVALDLPASPPPGELVLRLESEAAEGQGDVAGRFEIDPLL